jgi:hypothetical protein
MGTTANNSWPYPESSDYVADGATAIENLADAIDSGLGDVGLLSRGYVKDADKTVSVGISTTTTTLLSESVNVVAGRKYMLAWSGWTYATSTTMLINARIRINAATIQAVTINASTTFDSINMAMSRIWEAPSTGSVTVDISADTSTGTSFIRFTASRVNSNWLMIDVGE